MRYKKLVKCFLLIGVLLILSPLASAYGNSTEVQMEKLINAAWKELPRSIEVVVYSEKTKRPMSEAKIRSMVDKMYTATDGSAGNQSLDGRAVEIEAEVDRIMKEQNNPRMAKQQIWFQGHFMRIDENIISELHPLGGSPKSNSPTRTIVNAGNPLENDHTHFEYNHVTKMATIFDSKKKWHRPKIGEWCNMPLACKIGIQATLGKIEEIDEKKVFVPDQGKIKNAMMGNDKDGFLITIETISNGRDQITMSKDEKKYITLMETVA